MGTQQRRDEDKKPLEGVAIGAGLAVVGGIVYFLPWFLGASGAWSTVPRVIGAVLAVTGVTGLLFELAGVTANKAFEAYGAAFLLLVLAIAALYPARAGIWPGPVRVVLAVVGVISLILGVVGLFTGVGEHLSRPAAPAPGATRGSPDSAAKRATTSYERWSLIIAAVSALGTVISTVVTYMTTR